MDIYSVKEAYKIMQAECGIEVGDTVKVLRKAKSREMGWHTSWLDDDMTARIGKKGVVKDIGESIFVGIDGEHWNYPFFVLELIEKKKAEPEKMHTVEGKEYSESTLAAAMREYVK